MRLDETILKGYWIGVPRAYRFVLLELMVMADPSGAIRLPYGSTDLQSGLADLLQGNRREARSAIRFLRSEGWIIEDETDDEQTPMRCVVSIRR